MIRVLHSWNEIGEATKLLARQGLPHHSDTAKNWDLALLYELVQSRPKEARLVDLGCGGLAALKLLHAAGLSELHGVDLAIPLAARVSQMTPFSVYPFSLHRGDITGTKFEPASFDVASCISVIEHGVDTARFVAEASRILKPGGHLFVTTDYWEDEIDVRPGTRPFGLPWTPFSKAGITRLIQQAGAAGLSLLVEEPVPPCGDRCISWNGCEYTFICVVLKR
jgi:SAM-dependent methyltransferase